MRDLDAQVAYLRFLIETEINEPNRTAYLEMTSALIPDQQDGETTYLGLRRAPAAKGNHHDHEGGLLHHYLEMWELWILLARRVESSPELNNERILAAIINHDLHKAYRTFVLKEADPWQTEYGTDQSDRMMTWETKTIWLLGKHGVQLDELQMNALLWSEGGWAKIQPKWYSVLAKLAYLLDELSGNVLARIEKGTLLDVRQFRT